jgi:hypothetical protein
VRQARDGVPESAASARGATTNGASGWGRVTPTYPFAVRSRRRIGERGAAKVEPDTQRQPNDKNDRQGQEPDQSGVARKPRSCPGGESEDAGQGEEEAQKR